MAHTRNAVLPDVAQIHAIIQPYAEVGTLLPRTTPELCENIRDFLVAEENGQIVGCGALHLYGMHLAEIRSIAVSSDAKGIGAGRLLVEGLLREADRHSVTCVCLFTRIPDFFAHMGFSFATREELPDKIYKDCVHCPNLTACDEIAMVRGTIPKNNNGMRDPLIPIPLVRIQI
ncbi:MAG TPA: N-acetyltransferase [Candidatus Angelobacter sp.]|nr:N-acetyltransferase [Candidatus Angelobacter sp.]